MKRLFAMLIVLSLTVQLLGGCAAAADNPQGETLTAITQTEPQTNTGEASTPVSETSETETQAVESVESSDVQIDSSDAATLDDSSGVVASEDLSEYSNNEVLVLYTDGSVEVKQYESQVALEAGLVTLSEDTNVSLVQPNYNYDNTALSTQDALSAQQWALSNDGSFQMEEEKNSYPVFDEPFGKPAAPGQWTPPRGGGMRARSYNGTTTTQTTTAVAGIDIGLEEALEVYDGGSRAVVVALIDTGVDSSHEDLANALWVNEDEIAGNGVDDDGNGYVDDVNGWNFYNGNNQIYTGSEDSHGTHGAGTIAATANNGVGIAGIAQSDNVKVMVLKALGGEEGSGTTASIVQAIRYAEANGATICNLSLGTERDDRALYQAIANSSMLFVVAAGNESANTDSRPCYPASYDLDNILSVANLNYDGTLHSSSNYGSSSVDLAAPGSYILSTTTQNSYSYMTGTSMSAPMVTAAAALLYSYDTAYSLADVKDILLASAQPLASLSGKVSSGGMLDLGAALSYDADSLSSREFATASPTQSTASATGPLIQTQLVSQQGQLYLLVSVSSLQGELRTLSYASGELTAAQFDGGKVGKSFALDEGGMAIFLVQTGGTYTFYASDSAGGESVSLVTVNASGGMPRRGIR